MKIKPTAFFALALAGLLLACQSEGEQQQTDESATAATAQTTKHQDRPKSAPEPYQPPMSNDVLKLRLPKQSVAPGSTACVAIKAQSASKLLAMQYTIAWDLKVLKFIQAQDFRLPYLGPDNFGTPRAAEGVLPFVWIDNSLRGVSLFEEQAMFTLCFEVTGEIGQRSPLRIVNSPTDIELVNLQEQLMALDQEEGELWVE